MGTDQEDGVYHSRRRRVQRRKKAAVGIAGLVAILAGGGYAMSAWRSAQDSTVLGDIGALAPAPSLSRAAPTPSAVPPRTSPAPAPVSRAASPRLSAARQATSPVPTPSPARSSVPPTPMPDDDDDVAAAQVSHLLTAPRSTPSAGVAAAGGTIVVANEPGADGSAIRVLSARYDLTDGGSLLWAADDGVPVGDTRCTRNLRVDGSAPTNRPRVLLCWRVSAGKSVVTVATGPSRGPVPAASARVIDRVWQRLG